MEIIAKIDKPYSTKSRIDFVEEYQNKKKLLVKETETALEAWGYTAEEIEEQEQKHIQALSMTRSDFFDGMILAFGLNSIDLRTVIENVLNTLNITEIEKKIALNNYDNALHFYRKHTLFTLLSQAPIPISQDISLNISAKQWDKFFDETDKRNPEAYKELLPLGGI